MRRLFIESGFMLVDIEFYEIFAIYFICLETIQKAKRLPNLGIGEWNFCLDFSSFSNTGLKAWKNASLILRDAFFIFELLESP